jgi:nitrogen-specific signal transduction histidine kinase/ActR/RegA family two-component response regulator
VDRSGGKRNVTITCAPVEHKNGNIIGTVLVFRDMTEMKKREMETIKEQKLESVGVLAGGIAHDFNNILTAIIGNISLACLQLEPDDVLLYKRLEAIEKASLKARDLTQQLLTFSKGGTPIKKTISIVELIQDSASFALRGSNVKCDFILSDYIWPVEVDEGQMSQVINNLLINADQSMPEGGMIKISAENIVIKAGEALPLKRGKYVKITIEDHGTGIPREHLQKIFDPYFTTKQKGNGLGLAVTHSIIKNHHGYIFAESEVGVGTIFSVYLPASQNKLSDKKPVEKKPLPGKGKILLMDDDEIVREALGEMLESLGYTVEPAEEGAEAVELYKRALKSSQPFDVVIMDLTIQGGMGGREAIKNLLKIDSKVKAIVSSGYANNPIISDYKRYGFKGSIAKPYNVKELSEELDRVIKLKTG